MKSTIEAYNASLSKGEREICITLEGIINQYLPEAESKIWHAHPVWFLDENPVVGYSKLKGGIRLLFWSGVSFEDDKLKPGSGKFKDASMLYTSVDEIKLKDLKSWLRKAKEIKWDYKNVVKRKGVLIRLK
ncbi:MAG: DUF1801 domain-containing protein [Bacteroidia bacterium]